MAEAPCITIASAIHCNKYFLAVSGLLLSAMSQHLHVCVRLHQLPLSCRLGRRTPSVGSVHMHSDVRCRSLIRKRISPRSSSQRITMPVGTRSRVPSGSVLATIVCIYIFQFHLFKIDKFVLYQTHPIKHRYCKIVKVNGSHYLNVFNSLDLP